MRLIYISVRRVMEEQGQGRGSVPDYQEELRRGEDYIWHGREIKKGDVKINPAQMAGAQEQNFTGGEDEWRSKQRRTAREDEQYCACR